MFDNKFLKSAKDPLVEAVMQAQAEGALRRQAEALVNEEFGVYSRKALVREDLAAYDARLEEAYLELKEGNKDNKEKKKEHEEKTGMEHIKKMGGFPGQSPKRTARELTKEEKADKDYDRDGKIESEKDEVWGSRFAAAKRAGKMEEGMMDPKDSDATPASKTITKGKYEDPSTPKVPYSQLPKPGNRAGAVIDSAKGAAGMNEERKRTASVADAFMKGEKANQRTLRTDGKSVTYHGNTIAKHEGDEVHVTTAGHSLSPSTRGHINGILSRLGSDKLSVKKGQLHHGKNPVDHDAWIKVKKSTVSEEAYSAKAARAGEDIGKPGKNFEKIAKKAAAKYGSEERGKKVAGAILKRIRAKKMEEEASFNAAQETGKTVSEGQFAQGVASVLGGDVPGAIGHFGRSALTGLRMANRARLSAMNALDPKQARQSGYRSDWDKPAGTTYGPQQDEKPSAPAANVGDNKPAVAAPSATPTAPAAKTSATPAAVGATPASSAKPAATPAAKTAPLAGKSLQSRITDLAKTNKIANVNKIYAGKSMDVGGQKYTIQKGDTLTGIAKKFSSPGQAAAGSSSTSAAKPVPTPPSRPADLTPAKPEPVSPSSPATPTGASSAMKPNVGRTTLPGARTGDVTPTAKPLSATPDVGRTSSPSSPNSVTVAPEKSSTSDEKKKAPAPAPTTTMTESFVSVGENKYRIV